MVASRNKEDEEYREEFEKWKKEAQERIKKFKQGEIPEKAVYKWIMLINRGIIYKI